MCNATKLITEWQRWVKLRPRPTSELGPFIPQQRTFGDYCGMSENLHKLRRKGSETGANFAVCGYYSHGYDCAAALLSELARLSGWTGPFRSQVVRVIPIE